METKKTLNLQLGKDDTCKMEERTMIERESGSKARAGQNENVADGISMMNRVECARFYDSVSVDMSHAHYCVPGAPVLPCYPLTGVEKGRKSMKKME